MAKVIYFSQTGQTKKYVDKVEGHEKIRIDPDNWEISIDEPFILVMPSYEDYVHPIVLDTGCDFLETGDNIDNCKGIIGAGNINFGNLYCVTANQLSEEYSIPVIHKLEFQGSPNDVKFLKRSLDKIDKTRRD